MRCTPVIKRLDRCVLDYVWSMAAILKSTILDQGQFFQIRRLSCCIWNNIVIFSEINCLKQIFHICTISCSSKYLRTLYCKIFIMLFWLLRMQLNVSNPPHTNSQQNLQRYIDMAIQDLFLNVVLVMNFQSVHWSLKIITEIREWDQIIWLAILLDYDSLINNQ